MSFDPLSSAAIAPISIFGEPGDHGAAVTGIQGMGVRAPIAAAVAAATMGLAMDLHIPKGNIFTSGLLSITQAAGVPVKTAFVGKTIKAEGVAPKLHFIIAPIQTCSPISNR